MGDMGEVFEGMNAARKARHAEWKVQNLAALKETTFVYRETNHGETLLFREQGKPKVDFYPSTGRWRVAGVTQTYSGGAKSFIRWYESQKMKGEI